MIHSAFTKVSSMLHTCSNRLKRTLSQNMKEELIFADLSAFFILSYPAAKCSKKKTAVCLDKTGSLDYNKNREVAISGSLSKVKVFDNRPLVEFRAVVAFYVMTLSLKHNLWLQRVPAP